MGDWEWLVTLGKTYVTSAIRIDSEIKRIQSFGTVTKRWDNKRKEHKRFLYNKSINEIKRTFCSVGLSRWLRTGACGMAGFRFLVGGSGSTGKFEHNSSSVDMFGWWKCCYCFKHFCVRVQGRPDNNWRARCCVNHWPCLGNKLEKCTKIRKRSKPPKLREEKMERERETNKTFERRQKNIIVFRLWDFLVRLRFVNINRNCGPLFRMNSIVESRAPTPFVVQHTERSPSALSLSTGSNSARFIWTFSSCYRTLGGVPENRYNQSGRRWVFFGSSIFFLSFKVGLFMSGKKDNAQSENKHVQNKKEEVGQTQLTK